MILTRIDWPAVRRWCRRTSTHLNICISSRCDIAISHYVNIIVYYFNIQPKINCSLINGFAKRGVEGRWSILNLYFLSLSRSSSKYFSTSLYASIFTASNQAPNLGHFFALVGIFSVGMPRFRAVPSHFPSELQYPLPILTTKLPDVLVTKCKICPVRCAQGGRLLRSFPFAAGLEGTALSTPQDAVWRWLNEALPSVNWPSGSVVNIFFINSSHREEVLGKPPKRPWSRPSIIFLLSQALGVNTPNNYIK